MNNFKDYLNTNELSLIVQQLFNGKFAPILPNAIYENCHKQIMVSLVNANFFAKKATNEEKTTHDEKFQYDYIFRDIFSLLVFRNSKPEYGTPLFNIENDKNDLYVASKITQGCFEIILYCILLRNFKEAYKTAEPTKDKITSIFRKYELLKPKFEKLVNDHITDEIEEIKLILPDNTKVAFVLNILRKIIVDLLGEDYMEPFDPPQLTPRTGEILQKIFLFENVLYCRVEYYKMHKNEEVTNVEVNVINELVGLKDEPKKTEHPHLEGTENMLSSKNIPMEVDNSSLEVAEILLSFINTREITNFLMDEHTAKKLMSIKNTSISKDEASKIVDEIEKRIKMTKDIYDFFGIHETDYSPISISASSASSASSTSSTNALSPPAKKTKKDRFKYIKALFHIGTNNKTQNKYNIKKRPISI
jgi:hypothetical protein